MNAATVQDQLHKHANPQRAVATRRFFKTGPGQYGEGDIFWGLTTPMIRAIVREHRQLPLPEVSKLLESPVHEVRACGLLILVEAYKKGDAALQQAIVACYLAHTHRINNWDLVDISSCILGWWLQDKDRAPLYTLAASASMWEQRLAVVSTLVLIKQHDFADILNLCEILLQHPHDLMHKALGWMLREVGKKDTDTLVAFLEQHYHHMPRTTLRYAIERFPPEERKAWLAKKP